MMMIWRSLAGMWREETYLVGLLRFWMWNLVDEYHGSSRPRR